jgi:hypothetical protein
VRQEGSGAVSGELLPILSRSSAAKSAMKREALIG